MSASSTERGARPHCGASQNRTPVMAEPCCIARTYLGLPVHLLTGIRAATLSAAAGPACRRRRACVCARAGCVRAPAATRSRTCRRTCSRTCRRGHARAGGVHTPVSTSFGCRPGSGTARSNDGSVFCWLRTRQTVWHSDRAISRPSDASWRARVKVHLLTQPPQQV